MSTTQDRAMQAIESVFHDRTVSLQTTKERLEELMDKIDMYLDGIREDIKREADE